MEMPYQLASPLSLSLALFLFIERDADDEDLDCITAGGALHM